MREKDRYTGASVASHIAYTGGSYNQFFVCFVYFEKFFLKENDCVVENQINTWYLRILLIQQKLEII